MTGSRTMTGGDAIVAGLLAGGVDTVFGLPGVQIYGLFDAFARAGLRVLTPRHEQAASYMAYGYARSTGRTGVYAVVPGPGMLNSSAGLAAAQANCTPVLCLTGQVPTAFLGAGLGHLHEMPDQLATLRTMTSWAERISDPAAAPGLVAAALRRARSGRPGAVALEMAWDVFDRRAEVASAPALEPVPSVLPDSAALARAAEQLAAARNPMIIVGSGAFGAEAQVRELAELLQAPVVAYRSGRGVLPDDHPLGFTCAEGFQRYADTDLILGVGSRLELLWYRWPDRPPGLTVLDINTDPDHASRTGSVGLAGHAGPTVTALARLLAGTARPSRHAEFAALKAARRAEVAAAAPHADYLTALRKVLPRSGFVVDDMCQAGFAASYAFPVHEPRTFVSFGGFGALGHGLPTALGVKAAHPDRAVVALSGDGGFQFALQELATAVQEGLDVVTVVFDNGAYGNVLRDQVSGYSGRVLGSRLRNPDFVALAHSYGVHAERVTDPAGFGIAVGKALDRREPAVLVVPVDAAREPSPWPFLQPPSRKAADQGESSSAV